MARGRGHDAQLRERLKRSLGGGAAAAFAFLAEIAVEQQRDIAMVAEQDVCIADQLGQDRARVAVPRSEEHTSELQSLMRISYAVFCLKKKNFHYKSLTPQ